MEKKKEGEKFIAGYLEESGKTEPFLVHIPYEGRIKTSKKILYVFEFYVAPEVFQEFVLQLQSVKDISRREELIWTLRDDALCAQSNYHGTC